MLILMLLYVSELCLCAVVELCVNKSQIPIFYTLHATRLYIDRKCTGDGYHVSISFFVWLGLKTTCLYQYEMYRVIEMSILVVNYVVYKSMVDNAMNYIYKTSVHLCLSVCLSVLSLSLSLSLSLRHRYVYNKV